MNNTKILTKCIEALKEQTPDLSYVRGMLETLVEMQSPVLPDRIVEKGGNIIATVAGKEYPYKQVPLETTIDEASMLDGMAKAAIAKGIPTATE